MNVDTETLTYEHLDHWADDDLKTYEVIIKSSVAITVTARDLDDVLERWREVLACSADYMESLFDNAEVYRVDEQD